MDVIWENNVKLSDICEPQYRFAKTLSKRIKVTENENNIVLEAPEGCERYNQPENGGKRLSVPLDNPIYKGSILTCKGCKISNRTPYCPLKLAQYIRYLEKYQPEEEQLQRDKRNRTFASCLTGYNALPAIPYRFTRDQLEAMHLNHDAVIAAKYLIDNIISIPSFKNEGDYLACRFRCPGKYAKTLFDGILDKDILEYINNNPAEPEQGLAKIIDFVVNLPANPIMAKEIIMNSLCGKNRVPSNIYVLFYIIIAYSLLQTGGYMPYALLSAMSSGQDEHRLREQFGYPLPPLLKAKRRFYGLLQTNDTQEDKTIPLDIATYLRSRCSLALPIRTMTLTEFAESFAPDTRDGHGDSLSVIYREPEPCTVYLLDKIGDFLDYVPIAKKNGATYDRGKLVYAVLSFFKEMRDDYYFLICGTQKELERFLKIHPDLSWLFGKERLCLKDYTDKQMADIIHERYPETGIKKALAFLQKNRDKFPLKNEKLAGYIGNYYETHKQFPEPDARQKNSYREKLDKLTGLANIKEQAKRLCNLWKYMKTGKEKGLTFPAINTHMLFKGNPGTGKTTVARILADAMYDCGVCKERKLVEVHCPDLVAGYVGQTAIKTRKKIEKAIGGVLFVDEAYALTQSRGGFGDESLAVLVKMMEDHRDELTVIFAGYPQEMEDFMDANPGLRSRIGYTFNFEDYSEDELADIFEHKIKDCRFTLTKKAKEKVRGIVRRERNKPSFGNGRFIDKIVQETIMEKAQKETFSTEIDETDIPEEKLTAAGKKEKAPIGFGV